MLLVNVLKNMFNFIVKILNSLGFSLFLTDVLMNFIKRVNIKNVLLRRSSI